MFHFVRKFRESAATFVVAEMMMREVLVIHCRNFFLSLKIDNKDNILLESRERDENEISFLSHIHNTLQK